MSQAAESHSLVADFAPWLSMVAGAIGAGLLFAFTTGKKLAIVEQHAADLSAIRTKLGAIDRKLDDLMQAVTLVAKTNARLEAEVESLRRDLTRLEERGA